MHFRFDIIDITSPGRVWILRTSGRWRVEQTSCGLTPPGSTITLWPDNQATHIAVVRGQSGQGGRVNRRVPSKKASWKGKQMSPADQKAMDHSGLCYYHFTHDEEATKCRKPCACSGN
jgi:hypothetical protein